MRLPNPLLMNMVRNSVIHLGVCKITYELDEKALKIGPRIHQFSDEEVRRTIVDRHRVDPVRFASRFFHHVSYGACNKNQEEGGKR